MSKRRIIAFSILLVTLLAPALGGSTELQAQGILAVLTGILFLVVPPSRRLSRPGLILFGALFILALTQFLPAEWFGIPPWRRTLTQLSVALPWTVSAQPWITFEGTCLLFFGIVWACYLFAFRWDEELRPLIARTLALGILVLAITLILAFVLRERVPFWPNAPTFGFFANENQTGNVLGIGGVLIYAIGMDSLAWGRRFWWAWIASLAIICWALIINSSRAGLILFFVGALAWHLWWIRNARGEQRRAFTFIALGFFFVLLLINGGETLGRFRVISSDLQPEHGGRMLIYRDTLNVLGQVPFVGGGLGNFPALFALNRKFSAAENEAIHPESDWFWSAVDFGWLGPLILLALFIWWLTQCLPLNAGTSRRLRVAAMICGCVFALHGLFDVSGHRIGAIWPALLLGSLARHPRTAPRASTIERILFRFAGLVLLALGSWWIASTAGLRVWPTTANLTRIGVEVRHLLNDNQFDKAERLATEGLSIAPLSWKLYFNRATAEALSSNSTTAAERDFRIANFLMPYWPDVFVEQGNIWINAGNADLAFDAYSHALEISGNRRAGIYENIFGAVRNDAALRDRWRELAGDDKRSLLIFLRNANPVEFHIEFDHLLREDPQLSSFNATELETFFNAWYTNGDKLALADALKQHPNWEKIAWHTLANIYADFSDYRQAYETARNFVQPPQVPRQSAVKIETAQSEFRLNPNVENGLALYSTLLAAGRAEDAIRIIDLVSRMPGRPRYVWWLSAELHAQQGEWKNAWEAMAKYLAQQRVTD